MKKKLPIFNFSQSVFADVALILAATLPNFLLGALVFTLLGRFSPLQCNAQTSWWRSRDFRVDLFYVILNPVFKILLRFVPVAIIVFFLMLFMPVEEIYNGLANGWGPLSKFSPLAQCVMFLILSDFLLYWGHRLFHLAFLWPTHAIHHSAREVDWTAAYRFHPINLMLGPWLVTTALIFLGISAQNILFVAPIEVVMSFFVHANLNVTLGPLKYLIATPVFHRWHHTIKGELGAKNFGGIFSLWDVLFGTFYMPKDKIPQIYGVCGATLPENYFGQIIYPLKAAWRYLKNQRVSIETQKP